MSAIENFGEFFSNTPLASFKHDYNKLELIEFSHFRIRKNPAIIDVNTKYKTQTKMTRKIKNDKRKSFVSMYQYDIPDSGQNRYHSKYLKLVGATIACTFIGILIFIQLQKPVATGPMGDNRPRNLVHGLDQKILDQHSPDPGNQFRTQSATANPHQLRGFQKRQWETIEDVTTLKQKELRQRLKNIQLLISDLKYFPR